MQVQATVDSTQMQFGGCIHIMNRCLSENKKFYFLSTNISADILFTSVEEVTIEFKVQMETQIFLG